MKVFCQLIVLLSIAFPAFAHTGHGSGGGDFSLLHYLKEPEHAIGMLLYVILISGVVWLGVTCLKRSGFFSA